MGDFSICFSEHLTGHPNKKPTKPVAVRKRSPRQALLVFYLERCLSNNHLTHLCATLHNDDIAQRALGLYAVKHEETARGRGVGKDEREARGIVFQLCPHDV